MVDSKEPLDPQTQKGVERYWRNNKRIIAILLAVWFLVSFVLAILLVEPLNQFKLGGFPLGFWIGQQGAIYVFIFLILTYCLLMEYGDRKFHLEETKRKERQE
jgi:putative solute:sodium symporter small subunit